VADEFGGSADRKSAPFPLVGPDPHDVVRHQAMAALDELEGALALASAAATDEQHARPQDLDEGAVQLLFAPLMALSHAVCSRFGHVQPNGRVRTRRKVDRGPARGDDPGDVRVAAEDSEARVFGLDGRKDVFGLLDLEQLIPKRPVA
jgi:hypothetical protein